MWGSNTCAAAGGLADRTGRLGGSMGLLARAVAPSPRRVGRRGASRAAPRGGACPPSTPWPHQSRAVRRLPIPLTHHSRCSSAASGRCRAPGTAGRRGCRTGRPWRRQARQRQSQVCGVHERVSSGLGQQLQWWPLSIPDPGRDADLPGPAHLPAAHQVSPPLAWLLDSDQPSKQVATTKLEPHGARPPYSSAVGPPDRGDLCWIVSVGGCGSQAGRSALAGRCARGEAQPLGILNWQLSF
jgi:hypothetical protein